MADSSAARTADILAATLVNELFNSIAVHSTARSQPLKQSFEAYVLAIRDNPDSFWRLIDSSLSHRLKRAIRSIHS
jgi:hypothetical protein